jgi:RNA polymerase-binding transcription factor DksA
MKANTTTTKQSKRMTAEERKEYNKKYYAEHKEDIIQDLSQKVKCESCQTEVSKARLSAHKTTKLCRKRAVELYSTLEFLNNIIYKGREDKQNMSYDSNLNNIRNLLKLLPK